MRVCLIATELAGIGSYGGFGVLTREIAVGLRKSGLEVYITMPRRPGQKPIEQIDGLTVVSYPSGLYTGLKAALPFTSVYKMIDADIYHSQEPSLGTCLAQIGAPNKKHVVTFQDPRTFEERNEGRAEPGREEGSKISVLKAKVRFGISYSDIMRAMRKSDALFCQAWYVIPKVMSLYRLRKTPGFLPNPVEVPEEHIKKVDDTTVCFLGRWDPRKRPEYFFELAKKFRKVKFVAMGACSPHYYERERMLREKYSKVPNLRMIGWAVGEAKSEILDQSWILINTSWRECLPVSYLEACAHKCAILSHENPDDFASKFGYWAQKGDIEDFACGLEFLLENDSWKQLGEHGYQYVKDTHEFNKVIYEHISVYTEVLGR